MKKTVKIAILIIVALMLTTAVYSSRMVWEKVEKEDSECYISQCKDGTVIICCKEGDKWACELGQGVDAVIESLTIGPDKDAIASEICASSGSGN